MRQVVVPAALLPGRGGFAPSVSVAGPNLRVATLTVGAQARGGVDVPVVLAVDRAAGTAAAGSAAWGSGIDATGTAATGRFSARSRNV